MRTTRISVLIFSGFWLSSSLGQADEAARIGWAFAKAARLDGEPYQIARQVLESQGESLVPLLKEKAQSKNWREWSLAKALEIRRLEPQKAARWRWAIRNWQQDLRTNAQGRVVGTITDEVIQAARLQGETLAPGEVELPPEALPILIERLRESVASGGNSGRILQQSLFALKHWRDPQATGPILEYYEPTDEVQETLASFGPRALPELHQALQRANDPWPHPRQAALAAKVLGAIGDDTSARWLIEGLSDISLAAIRADFCEAIVRLKPPNGPDVLFSELRKMAFERNDPRSDLDQEAYLRVRSALLGFGSAAKPVLDRHLKPPVAVEIRAMAAGMAHELSHPGEVSALYQEAGEQWILRKGGRHRELRPEGIRATGQQMYWSPHFGSGDFPAPLLLEKTPAALLIEMAVVSREEPLIERLSHLEGEALGIEALTWLLSPVQSRWSTRRAAILPLAEMAGEKALAPLREFVTAHPLTELDRVIEAAIVIAHPNAGELLETLLEHPQARRRLENDLREKRAAIQAIVEVLNQRPGDLSKLLELEDPGLRLAAARSLAKRGEVRSVGVLFASILEAAGGKPGHASLHKAHQAQKAIVDMGKPAFEAIDTAAKASPAKFAKLLAEVLRLRITRPDLEQKVQNALYRRWPGWGKHTGPSLADIQFAGREIAKIAGEESLPLLEARIVWPVDGASTLAAFAVAQFQQDRSLDIVVEHAGQLAFGGAALKEFGEKGIAAAKHVAVPDPNQPRFGMRRGRHREATTALTMAEEPQGIDGILAGLKLAAEGQIPAAKANAYLELAAGYEDKRLIPAILSVVEKHGSGVAFNALDALKPYEDERLLPVFLRFVGEPFATGDLALKGIARLQGEKTVPLLLKRLKDARDEATRLGILHALVKFRSDSRLFANTKLSEDDLTKAAPEIREALIQQLDVKEQSLRFQAAESLAKFAMGRRDKAAMNALVQWMAQDDNWPRAVTEFLLGIEDPSIAPELLTLYQKDPLQRTDLALYFAEITYEPALDDVVRALQKRLNPKEAPGEALEVKILASYGALGQDALWEFLEPPQSLAFRVSAYGALCRSHDKRAFEPTAELLQELLRDGLWHAELRPRDHQDRSDRYRVFVLSLAESLLALNTERAYPIVARGCLFAQESGVQSQLAGRLVNLQNRDPNYRKPKVPLDAIEPPPVAADAEVPLLEACKLWRKIVTEHHGQIPEGVGKRLMATGQDGLQVAVELFYDWPTPTREEIAQALRNLTDRDASVQREAAALLAVRRYPAQLLDAALANATGETLVLGAAIWQWRQSGGEIQDAGLSERGAFTNLLLAEWPIAQLRAFTLRNLARLASIPNEAYIWSQKPLFPMLLSVRYSPKESERVLIRAFTKKASPAARQVSAQVGQHGVGGFTGTSAARWNPLPPLP